MRGSWDFVESFVAFWGALAEAYGAEEPRTVALKVMDEFKKRQPSAENDQLIIARIKELSA